MSTIESSEDSKPIVCMDATELDNFELCDFRWHMFHHRHVRNRVLESHFEKGTLLHYFLELYYKQKIVTPAVESVILETIIEQGRVKSLEFELTLEEVSETVFQFREYVRFYENENIIPLHVEQPFTKELYEDENIKVLLSGVPDLIFRYSSDPIGVVNVMDHKRMAKEYNYSPLRNQFLMYATAVDTDTVIINKVGFQKTKKVHERMLRTPFVYNRDILEEWKYDVVIRARQMVVDLNNEFYPRNRSSCEKWSGCYLQRYCTTRPKAREFLIGTEYKIGKPWDVGNVLEDGK